jgi:predicted XRE-type DNA-binding protein
MRKKARIRAEASSGNVFADLGLPNPEQELLKARLTLQIYKLITARGLTQAQAGKILGIKQPHVSTLMRNRAGNFSVGRLIEFLTALGAGRGDHGQADTEGAWRDVGGPAMKADNF